MSKYAFKLLTQVQLEKLETNVRTFGELKQAILNSPMRGKINFNEVKFIEKETKAEYGSIDDATLPTGDLLFFVTPTKTKSGVEITADNFLQFDMDEVLEFVDNLGYNEIRRFASFLNNKGANITISGTRYEIAERVSNYIETKFEETDSKVEELIEVLSDAVESIQLVIKALESGAITKVDALQAEAERLRNLLNKR